jgi:hypothetical protein
MRERYPMVLCARCGWPYFGAFGGVCDDCLRKGTSSFLQPGAASLGPGSTPDRLANEIEKGARLVVYQYAWSALLISSLGPSKPVLIRPGMGDVRPGLRYILLTLAAGWWGVPWGPIYTIRALNRDLHGGIDVTSTFQDLYYRATQAAGQTTQQPQATWHD